jgi:hypothetical protein
MSVEEQIAEARRSRLRRGRRVIFVVALASTTSVLGSVLLPDRSPLLGVFTISLAIVLTLAQRYADGDDAWQRQMGLTGFKVGAAIGICWLIVHAVWAAADSRHHTSPGAALDVIGTSWLCADLFWRVRAHIQLGRG